jgi:hypothetical protein
MNREGVFRIPAHELQGLALPQGSTIPGILRASFANPGITNMVTTGMVSTLKKNIDLLPYFWK